MTLNRRREVQPMTSEIQSEIYATEVITLRVQYKIQRVLHTTRDVQNIPRRIQCAIAQIISPFTQHDQRRISWLESDLTSETYPLPKR